MIDLVQEDRFKKDVDLRDSAGVTPIMVAVNTGSNVMHYLAIKPVALLDIITAEEKYTKETIVNLLNTRNSESKTPLHLACEEDKPEMVTAMMIQGADFNILSSSDDVTDQDSP